jgi:hypothetical protein
VAQHDGREPLHAADDLDQHAALLVGVVVLHHARVLLLRFGTQLLDVGVGVLPRALAQHLARPLGEQPQALEYDVAMRPGVRFRQELGALVVLAVQVDLHAYLTCLK